MKRQAAKEREALTNNLTALIEKGSDTLVEKLKSAAAQKLKSSRNDSNTNTSDKQYDHEKNSTPQAHGNITFKRTGSILFF